MRKKIAPGREQKIYLIAVGPPRAGAIPRRLRQRPAMALKETIIGPLSDSGLT
jgi:hypothetical protein